MQRETQTKVLNLLQKATSEKDISSRLRTLLQCQEVLHHADTSIETVGSFLDYFLNLQTDPNATLRRFAAHFLHNLVPLKPLLSLRCLPALMSLLKDDDGVVQEIAARCACVLHGRALPLLSLEQDKVQFQRSAESLRQLRETMVELAEGGCPGRPELFRQVIRFLRIVVLVQTPSPLVLRVRVPTDLRGASCLQDLPALPGTYLDLDGLHRQATELFQQLCRWLDDPPQGRWPRKHVAALLQAVTSICRQRPDLFQPLLDLLRRLLRSSSAVLERKQQEALPVAPADAEFLHDLVVEEIQCLMASQVAAAWHADLVELLSTADGVVGSMEDLLSQAKYHQIHSLSDSKREKNGEPKAKKARAGPKRVWLDNNFCSHTSDGGGTVANEDAFDCDALLSGETEQACRLFEDYFGLPSQREPSGHVAGPALLASRINNRDQLARLALTSLNSLAEKRFLLRDKAHERVVLFKEPSVRKAADAVGDGKNGAKKSKDPPELAYLLSAKPEVDEVGKDDAATGRDPRAALQRKRSMPEEPSSNGAGPTNGDATQMLGGDIGALKLPQSNAARDNLELMIYNEVLESQGRMDASLLPASLSARQVEAFEMLGRQVALHLVSGRQLPLNPNLQRAMCGSFMARSLDILKAALDGAVTTPTSVPLGQLAELFYAKFSADVARSQESSRAARNRAAGDPVRDVLDGGPARTNFTYTELFDTFLVEFDKRELDRRQLRTLLSEVPALPASVFKMLESQCRNTCKDGKERKVALMTVLALLEARPACRWECLGLLFRVIYSAGSDEAHVRYDAIRLIINKIYDGGARPPTRWQLPHLADTEALPLIGAGDVDDITAAQDDSFLTLKRTKGRCIEDMATLLLRSMAPPAAKFRFSVKASKRLMELHASLASSTDSAELPTTDRVWLYLALCIKRPLLLHGLVETFTQCDEEMRQHFVSSVEEAIKHIDASNQELLTLVQKATPQTEQLVLKVLHILMQRSRKGSGGLSPAYGDAVRRLYEITQNPRLLVPVFDLLDRKYLLDFLPSVLQLEKECVTDAFEQLLSSKSPPLTVTELLTELHHMNTPTENIVPVKRAMEALNILFGMKDKFDSKVYGIVIQSLVEEPGRLPTLFMRTVIQVVKELPRLCDFILMEILPRLVRQEVYRDEQMWKGFMIVLRTTFPLQPGYAARVLAMLPSSHLEDVLVQHPDWKKQLSEFVARQPFGTVPEYVKQLCA
eukprot:TRINITY_DN947_c0_g2_i1.p1 TRINITY_DN947_c0_g2~~TRINITY_DN947_c0_g2_i1.p1  ORF type:complete len:1251 (+),score=242.59 TRINITY_DN947_c0_g2_i1:86-3754(+)